MASVSIVDISGADGRFPTRKPWWFGPAIVAIAVGATIGIVMSEPARPPTLAEMVRESIEKFSRLTSYHKVGVATYPDPKNARGRRQITVDVERPGKTRIVWDDISGSTEFLQVDNRRYERQPPEGWFENAFRQPDPSGLASQRSPLGEPWAVADPSTMREVDQPRIDGLATHHIRYTATPTVLADTVFAAIGVDTHRAFKSGVNVQSTVEVWIRTVDMEVVRVRYALINGADEYRFEESYLFRDAPTSLRRAEGTRSQRYRCGMFRWRCQPRTASAVSRRRTSSRPCGWAAITRPEPLMWRCLAVRRSRNGKPDGRGWGSPRSTKRAPSTS